MQQKKSAPKKDLDASSNMDDSQIKKGSKKQSKKSVKPEKKVSKSPHKGKNKNQGYLDAIAD